MFSRQLVNGDASMASETLDPMAPQYHMADYGYGKQSVRVFQLEKHGSYHSATEYMVSSHMRLRSHKEYYEADNSDIVGSDVMETHVYVHAQKHGLSTPEEFALSLTQHFLDTYDGATDANVLVEDLGWERLGEHENQGLYKNKPHNHVFLRNSNGKRYCEVVRRRREAQPLLMAGITDLRMVKTACAPFTGYVKGSLYTEGDLPDRVLCVDVNAKWQYAQLPGVDFATHWHRVRDIVLQSFAGDPVKGNVTTSVQYISYITERAILDAMPEIASVSISVANYTHLPFDFSRFPDFERKSNVIICNPRDVPRSMGYAQLNRLNKEINGKNFNKEINAKH